MRASTGRSRVAQCLPYELSQRCFYSGGCGDATVKGSLLKEVLGIEHSSVFTACFLLLRAQPAGPDHALAWPITNPPCAALATSFNQRFKGTWFWLRGDSLLRYPRRFPTSRLTTLVGAAGTNVWVRALMLAPLAVRPPTLDAHQFHEVSIRSAGLRPGAFPGPRDQHAGSEIGAPVPGKNSPGVGSRFGTQNRSRRREEAEIALKPRGPPRYLGGYEFG
jgi:hypothetical protein